MKQELWIENGQVFTEQGFLNVTIKIKDEKIQSLERGSKKGKGVQIIDAKGCLVVPGFIDAHVHFNDPGRSEWEGFETGTKAAAIGGTTTIFDMPLNCFPSVTSLQTLLDKKEYVTPLSFI